MPESFVAALAGLCSAAVLEVLRHLLRHSQKTTSKSMDDATAFRHDLLARIVLLEQERNLLEQESDEWQEQYYQEREKHIHLQ